MKEILKNKKVIIALSILVLITLIVVIIRRNKKSEETSGSDAVKKTPADASKPEHPLASFPLTPYSRAGEYSTGAGSYGQQIANLQKICNGKFGKDLVVDGKFGPKSEAAFLTCFGAPLQMPYSEEVYNGLMLQHGGGII